MFPPSGVRQILLVQDLLRRPKREVVQRDAELRQPLLEAREQLVVLLRHITQRIHGLSLQFL